MQQRLGQENSWLVGALAVLTISFFGVALLGFVLPPGLEELEHPQPVSSCLVEVPPLPEDLDIGGFWETAGFYVAYRDKSFEAQRRLLFDEHIFWFHEYETLVLAPQRYGQMLSGSVLQLVEMFVDWGWPVQIEAETDGYVLSLWYDLANTGQKIPVYTWHLKTLNPQNHSSYVLGYIPLLGGFFDPYWEERGTPALPVLAIIIDDWGYAAEAVDSLLAYPLPLTIAVLPHLILSREVSERAVERGHEVILHQPMEADSLLDLGPGGITVKMLPEEIVAQIDQNLNSLPLAVGMNNHMGSRATANTAVMEEVLKVLKKRGLFFVDSRTTAQTVAAAVANSLEIPYSENNLFIDNENEVAKIKEQIRKSISLAKKQGHAVAIGHVRPQTALALWEMIPELLDSEVQLVPVSNVVH